MTDFIFPAIASISTTALVLSWVAAQRQAAQPELVPVRVKARQRRR